jgi:hypothetical protein
MLPVQTEPEAISNFVSAWDGYFSGASVNGIPIQRAAYQPALAALRGSLVGMSAPGAGPAKIQSAITAFWSALGPLGPSLWVLAPAVITPPLSPPPGLGGIAGALQGVFTSNAQNEHATLASCAQAIASALHSAGGVGGIAIVQPPPTAPPVPTPIL